MPYRKIFFEAKKSYHIVTRAVVDIFRKKEDCYRLIFYFQAANLGRRNPSINRRDIPKVGQALLMGEKVSSKFIIKEHPPFVDLIEFCLTINHPHFYLISNADNIVPVFMQRFKEGFSKSFNATHNRENVVFGSPYKAVEVNGQFQSYAVIRYVSIINALDVYRPGWREGGLKDPEGAWKFLKTFEFSSFFDKVNNRNNQILALPEILEQYSWGFGAGKEKEEFQKFVKEFLKDKSNYTQFE